MSEKHRATIGVFGIPQNEEGRGLWAKRGDGKGINAIGGTVDPEDAQSTRTLIDVLKREFREEAGVEIEVVEERPLGVFPIANLQDVAILFNVRIVSGEPKPTAESAEFLWMSPGQVIAAADLYDAGIKANGLLSGKGKRQWQMARAFFKYASQSTVFRDIAQAEM